MGRAELALALRLKGEAEIKAIRQQVEAEAERYRQQRQQEVSRQGDVCELQADQSTRQECRQVDWQVAKHLRSLRLKALQELDRRLWHLLKDEIANLDVLLRRSLLDKLAAEIPKGAWQRVVVHPDDETAAKGIFPDRKIETDMNLGAGLVVETEDGNVRIDNSLLRRLEQIWPELCSQILSGLEESAEGERQP